MKKGKILFTGGNGFIGRQIIPLLEEEGWDIVRPRSSKVRLEVDTEVDTLFENDVYYDAIINAALVGGRRDVDDSRDIFYRNMMMFETLFRYVDRCGCFINFDSGASLGRPAISERPQPSDLGKIVPGDPYGFSKYCIAQRVVNHPRGRNLRVWGCFGEYEEFSRFFATNVKNYINKKPITLIKDRFMDFIYADDLYKIVSYFLNMKERTHIDDVNCVYEVKYLLSEIAEMINNLDDYKVEITSEGQYPEHSYCGAPNDLGLDYIGLEQGIKECWSKWK